MAELIIPSERVTELTAAPRRLPIDIEGSVTYEIPLTIWTSFYPKDKDAYRTHDLGKEWFQEVRKATADDLAAELSTLGGPFVNNWLAIANLMLAAPHPHSPDRVFAWLDGVNEQRLRRWILGYYSHDEDQALIEQAASGDVAAAVELLGEAADKKPELVEHFEWLLQSEGMPARYADGLRRFHHEVFADFEEEFAGAISRAAAARRAMPTRGSAKEVVEEVTSGIDVEIPMGVSRVVLIPSVVVRPLSVIDTHRGTLYVYYGIADEFIDSDPEAPPSWLVRTYKALGDERRLRIMRRLGEGSSTLDDLSDLLGVSKSTAHHHLSLLRGAGLVRVHVPGRGSGKKKTYSIREEALNDASAFLDNYVKTTEETAS